MTESSRPEHAGTINALKAWQVIEVIFLLVLIPVTFGFAVVFTGDSDRLFNNYITFVLPFMLSILVAKIAATIAFFRDKRWSFYYNYIEGIVLFAVSAVLVGLDLTGGIVMKDVSLLRIVLSLLFPVMFAFLFWKLIGIYRNMLSSGAAERSE
jgi:hypothetical protein